MPIFSGDDVGRRAEHLMELQKYWSDCLGILTAPGFHTASEQVRAENLKTALDLLMTYAAAGFSATTYAKWINDLPPIEKDNHETT